MNNEERRDSFIALLFIIVIGGFLYYAERERERSEVEYSPRFAEQQMQIRVAEALADHLVYDHGYSPTKAIVEAKRIMDFIPGETDE